MPYYLGPVGAVQQVRAPSRAYQVDAEVIGSKRRAISGRLRVSRVAVKRSWDVQWTSLTDAQFDVLNGLYLRGSGSGSLLWSDPRARNLLLSDASSGGDVSGGLPATITSDAPSTSTWSVTSTTTGATNGFRAILATANAGGSPASTPIVRTTAPQAIVPGLSYVFSAYVTAAQTVDVAVVWLDAAGATVSTIRATTAAGTKVRGVVTGVAPATATHATVRLLVPVGSTFAAGQTVTTDSWQLEQGSTASGWQIGEGAALVYFASLTRIFSIPGYVNASARLEEV